LPYFHIIFLIWLIIIFSFRFYETNKPLLKKYDRFGGYVYRTYNEDALNIKELKAPMYYLNKYNYYLDSLLESTYNYYSDYYKEESKILKL